MTCIVAVWFGIVLCAWEMVVKPVDIEGSQRHPNMPGKVIFVKTVEDPTADWQEKIASMIDGRSHGAIFLTGGDLNTFLKRSVKSSDPRTNVNFNTRVTGGEFVVGVIVYSPVRNDPFCVQAVGGFEKGKLGYYFAPRRMYIGALPLPKEIATPLMGALFSKMFDGPQLGALMDSWRTIKDLKLRDNRMVLSWE